MAAEPGTASPEQAGLARVLQTPVWRDAVLPTLALRPVFLVFSALALLLFRPEAFQPDRLTDIWVRWDVRHYLDIAASGYGPEDPVRIVFFPLFPALIAIGSLVFDPVVAGLTISAIMSLIAAGGLYTLARMDFGATSARAAVLMMSIFPTAFALVVPYTEAPFLAFAVWSFVMARRGQWSWAAILALLASATRLPGAFLIPALAVEYWRQRRSVNADALWLLLPLAGPLGYLALNLVALGDPLYFLTAQREIASMATVPPWVALEGLINGVLHHELGDRWVTLYVSPMVALLLLAGVTVWCLAGRGRRPSYAVYAGLSLLSFASLSWPISVPRYLMGVFPLFLAAGALASRSWLAIPLFVGSALLCAMFTLLFVLGQWAF